MKKIQFFVLGQLSLCCPKSQIIFELTELEEKEKNELKWKFSLRL